MKPKRFDHIDFLRATAIIGMIAVHTLQYDLTGILQYFFWNFLHFVEALFVFCSGFVLFEHYQNQFTGIKNTLLWYKKRLTRILLPFYIYLVCHYILMGLFPRFFSGMGLVADINFLVQSVLLTGGISINWLVLLFLELTLLFPLIIKIVKDKKANAAYIIFILLTTVFFSIKDLNNIYRLVMWIPWSLIFLYSMILFKNTQPTNNKYFRLGLASLIIFIVLSIVWGFEGRSLRLIDNKYPPNILFLSYSFAAVNFLYLVSRLDFLKTKIIKDTYLFVSRNSYQLFFIHFIVLDFIRNLWFKFSLNLNTGIELIMVILLSIFVSFILNKLKNVLYQLLSSTIIKFKAI